MKSRVLVEIDLDALARNYMRIAKRVSPADVLCVLKANAYGLGVAAYARSLMAAGCKAFGVAEPKEALELVKIVKTRTGRPKADVQILSSILPDEITPMLKAGVILPVASLDSAKLISSAAKKMRTTARVHFKIDTGMGRLGILHTEALTTILAILKLPHLKCEGIFSHCAMAYDPLDNFTALQIQNFKNLLLDLKEKGVSFNKVHIAASDAINNFPQTYQAPFTTVRTGINLHGSFDPNGRKALKLEPVLTLKSRVAQVRTLAKGTTLGYGRTCKLSKESLVAIVSAGYADGLPLALTNKGSMFIGGKRCKILGRVSMDYTAVDISATTGVKPGDEAICLGKCGSSWITPDDWAEIKGTHAYDIICSLGSRVERVVRRGGRIIKERKI